MQGVFWVELHLLRILCLKFIQCWYDMELISFLFSERLSQTSVDIQQIKGLLLQTLKLKLAYITISFADSQNHIHCLKQSISISLYQRRKIWILVLGHLQQIVYITSINAFQPRIMGLIFPCKPSSKRCIKCCLKQFKRRVSPLISADSRT